MQIIQTGKFEYLKWVPNIIRKINTTICWIILRSVTKCQGWYDDIMIGEHFHNAYLYELIVRKNSMDY